ncbi:MAG TPA: phosphoadenosine phosphosulfate reductase family protein [Nitrospira sp.]|nr:phosphoadenosine phosphosulfate reductase family protein [Nitrospira sp.]HNN16984.1 phosphoadenosine phosphosulfate reductase family protein [Giesbergeria sp.]
MAADAVALARLVAESLLSAIKRQAMLTDQVIVSYSGGKDSAVTLDLCVKHFAQVEAFFMYQVPGLSFQERVLRWSEDRYGIEIYRIPHFELSDFYRGGVYCKPDPTLPKVGIQDVYAHVRQAFDIHWIAAGERAKDSIVRNATIKKSGSIDQKRGRFYPLAYWSKEAVTRYIAANKLMVSPESKILGHSFRSLHTKDLIAVKEHYPQDYERIAQVFPEVGVALAREAMYG